MVFGDTAFQRPPQFWDFLAQMTTSVIDQPLRPSPALDQALNHPPPADPQNICGDAIEFDIGVLQYFVDTIMNAIAILLQMHTVTCQVSQLPDLGRRNETAAQ